MLSFNPSMSACVAFLNAYVLRFSTAVLFFFLIAVFALSQYFHFIIGVSLFIYDWMPSDGDHLNFAHRIIQGLPVYLSIAKSEVLNIYNPFYYILVGLLGGEDASISFARTLSLVFWLACPLFITVYFFRKWKWYAVLASIFVMLPSEPYMLLDIVNVTPDSTMAFFFLITVLAADYFVTGKENSKWVLLGLGGLAVLAFLSKQQGIIAIASVFCFVAFKRKSMRDLYTILLGFIVPLLFVVVYFEIVNSGNFLYDTLFGLGAVMVTMQGLALDRLTAFLLHHAAFMLCVTLSFILLLRGSVKLSIWHISFILHILLLLKTLGNAGGGPNYFVTFWITIVIISIDVVMVFMRDSTPFLLFHRWFRLDNFQPLLSQVLLFFLFVNISLGTISIHKQINSIPRPTAALNQVMHGYYETIAKLMENTPDAKVLTNRNVGALVVNHVNVSNEGSTMFQYAWAHPGLFNQNTILTNISDKKYDFIFTGLQPYPANVQARIKGAYKEVLSIEEAVYLGNIALVKVYVPK